jgi:hypothetical protein
MLFLTGHRYSLIQRKELKSLDFFPHYPVSKHFVEMSLQASLPRMKKPPSAFDARAA